MATQNLSKDTFLNDTLPSLLVSFYKVNETVVKNFLNITELELIAYATNVPQTESGSDTAFSDALQDLNFHQQQNTSFTSPPCKPVDINFPMHFLKHNDTFDEAMVKNSVE